MSKLSQDKSFYMWVIHWNRVAELVKRGFDYGITPREADELEGALIKGSQYSHKNAQGQWVSVWPAPSRNRH